MRKVLSLLVIFTFLFSGTVFASENDMQKQIDELRSEMKKMSVYYEKRISHLEAKLEAASAAEHENHAGWRHDNDKEDLNKTDKHSMAGHAHHHGGLGDKVKVIGAFDGRFVRVDSGKNTFMMHEAKVGLQADITEWLFAYATLTKHHGEDVHVEEAYAILKYDEWGLAAKPGQFFVKFGPENQAHFFDRRTITFSPMHEGMFAEESWTDAGVQFAWTLPVDFYSDLSIAVLNGNNASSFGDGTNEVTNNNLPIVVNWTNAFKLDNGLIRFAPSFAWGKWDTKDKYDVYLAGGDVYYKFGNFDAQAEFIYRYKEQMPGTGEENAYGYYVLGAYTFPVGWEYLDSIELLFSFSQFIPDSGIRETRYTPQIAFNLNEYAKLRATYEVRDEYPEDEKDNRIIGQCALAF